MSSEALLNDCKYVWFQDEKNIEIKKDERTVEAKGKGEKEVSFSLLLSYLVYLYIEWRYLLMIQTWSFDSWCLNI